MRLHTKTFLFAVVAFVAILAGVALVFVGRESADFAAIERDQAMRAMERVKAALDRRRDELGRSAHIWAARDDTYDFIVSSNATYVKRNLTDEALRGAEINFLMLITPSGRVACAKVCEVWDDQRTPQPAGQTAVLPPVSPLVQPATATSMVAGFMVVSNRVCQIAARPILTSQGQGPMRGSLVAGRFLDRREERHLADAVGVTVRLRPVRAVTSAATVMIDAGAWRPTRVTASADSVHVAETFMDIQGEPCLVAEIDVPREIMRQGRRTLWAAIAMAGLVGMVPIVAMGAALERLVLRRLRRLRDEVERRSGSGDSGDSDERGRAPDGDELARLGAALDAVLVKAQRTQGEVLAGEDRYAKLMESSPDGVCVTTHDAILFANAVMARILGVEERDELMSAPLTAFLPPDAGGAWERHVLRVQSAPEEAATLALRLAHPDGGMVELDVISVAIAYQGAAAVQSLVRDVTQQHLDAARQARCTAQIARYHSALLRVMREPSADFTTTLERLLELIARTLPVARASYWRFHTGQRRLACVDLYALDADRHEREDDIDAEKCPRYCAALEQAKTIMADDALTDARTSEIADSHLRRREIGALLNTVVRSQGVLLGVLSLAHVGGPRAWSHEEEEFASSIANMIALAIEADQRRRAEEALRQSEQRVRLAQQLAGMGTWEWDMRTNAEVWSPSLHELFGLPPNDGEMHYDDFLKAIHPHDRQAVEAAVRACLESGTPYEIEHRILRPDGEVRWVAERGNVVRDADGTPTRMLGVTMDINARKQAEHAIADEKERLAVTLRSIGDAVVTTDVDGRIVLMNRVAEELTGWTNEEARGRPLEEIVRLFDERTRAARSDIVARVMSAGAIVALDETCVLVARAGQERLVRDSAAPIHDRDNRSIGVVVVLREVTAARRMEEEILKAQKLESVSILAGGIAHDFNNLLTIMLGNISLARMSSDNSAVVADRLADAESAIEQAMHLTRQLLAFSRGSSPTTQHTSICQLLRDTVPLLVRGTAVRCELSAPETLWSAEIDAGQISQVINNLVINAVQAMPNGGDLRVAAENVRVREPVAPQMPPGAYVRIAIGDTGSGIAADALARIFDPYFTTKPKGNGLGLTISYSIVKNHKGAITVDSVEGRGTTFNIYLPATVPTAAAAPAPAATQPAARGRVLLMDDEQIILRTTCAVLQKLGFAVAATATGEEAVQAYTAALNTPAAFDVVILDMTVPGGMGGMDTLRALAQLDPNVRAVATSGYFNDDLMSDLRTVGFRAMLRKPYTVAQLQETVRNVMKL